MATRCRLNALRSLIIAMVICIQLPVSHGIQLFGGMARVLFTNVRISQSCNAVLDRNLSCPWEVTALYRPDFSIGWTPTKLSAFCERVCQDGLLDLVRAMESSCQQEELRLRLGNFTLGAYGELLRYRAEQLCLRDEEAKEDGFCLFARDDWDVSRLYESGQATWPEHTEKCLLDEDGRCGRSDEDYWFIEWGFEEYVNLPDWVFQNRHHDYAAFDFRTNRSDAFAAANRHSLGWETRLELDEFPLEIQCRPCFWKPLTLAYRSKWGHLAWDEWSESIWKNIVKNCNITGEDATVVPWRNLTAEYPEDFAIYDDVPDPYWEPRWDLCPLTYTVPDDFVGTIKEITKSRNLSTACLESFNKDLPFDGELLRGRKLCVPRTCEIEVVTDLMGIGSFISSASGRFSTQQFWRWNPCLARQDHLSRGDTVCVGPHGGRYEPKVVSLQD